MTKRLLWAAVLSAVVAYPAVAEPFLRGVGAVAVNSDADVQAVLRELKPRGFNHLQASLALADPATPARVRLLHDNGFIVYDYFSAFIDQPAPRDDFQIKVDGTIKTGTVCPRSRTRIDEMTKRCVDAAGVGADGTVWDFITVESWEDEACFCPKCLGALNAALGKDLSREQAVAAIAADPEVRLVWRRVREESTSEAMRVLCEQVHAILGDKPFMVGGYVLGSHSGLGMDTGAMYQYLDVGAPMIYQATGPAPLGWMLEQLAGFQALGGKAQNVVCVDTGFFVKEPWKELLATSYDCMRGKAEGSCLWPFATVSQDDLEAMAVLNRLYVLVYQDVSGKPVAQPAEGLAQWGREFAGDLPDSDLAVLTTLGGRLQREPGAVFADDFAHALWPVLTAAAEQHLRKAHASDVIVDVAPYRLQMAADGSQLAISTKDWALTQNAMAENVDEVVYRGGSGNAATGNANLGLLRLRIIGWFDGWASRNETRLVSQDANHVAVRTSVKSDTCEYARTLTLRRGSPWIDCELEVTNLDSKPHEGKAWLWNGFGIPGYLERDPASPWSDDVATLIDNVLTISDEGCHLSIAADSADLKLGGFGGDGTSHAYCDLKLAPGEVWRTNMQLSLWRD